eukprot:scaffold220_cov43-Phaeocystis_antarctica.AAC.1
MDPNTARCLTRPCKMPLLREPAALACSFLWAWPQHWVPRASLEGYSGDDMLRQRTTNRPQRTA